MQQRVRLRAKKQPPAESRLQKSLCRQTTTITRYILEISSTCCESTGGAARHIHVHFYKTGRYILGGVRLVCCCTIRMYVADTMPVPANLHREKTWTRASSYPHHGGGTSLCRLSTSICQTRGSAHHNNKEIHQSLDPQTLSERVEAGVCSAEFSQNSAPSAASRFDLRSELPSLQADILCFR